MNKQLENKIGHQKREIAALRDKVARLEKHCLEFQNENEALRQRISQGQEDRR